VQNDYLKLDFGFKNFAICQVLSTFTQRMEISLNGFLLESQCQPHA